MYVTVKCKGVQLIMICFCVPKCLAELSEKEISEKSEVKCTRTENLNLLTQIYFRTNIRSWDRRKTKQAPLLSIFFLPAYLDLKRRCEEKWLTDWACWRPKACVLKPPQHSSFLQKVTEKDRFILSASECAQVVKWSDVQRRNNSIHSCQCLCCYILIILYRMYIEHVHTLKWILLPIWYNRTLMWMF